MNTHRKIILSAGLLVALVVATPVGAHASPLLSGYGGPGQGSQMILGSSLLNGPGGGGQAAAAREASTAATNGGLGSAPAGSSVSIVHGAHGAVLHRRSSSGSAAAGTSGGAAGISPAAAHQAAPPALGVSQNDLFYILLALAILAFAGVLTRRLTHPHGRPARGG